MSTYWIRGLVGILLLISLTGVGIGAEPSGYMVYVQGEQSSITRTADGMFEVTIMDIIPFSPIVDGDEVFLAETKHLVNESYPKNAALILSGSDMEVTSLVEIYNLSLDTEQNSITFLAQPLEFYSGELLKPFSSERGDLGTAIEKATDLTALYLEIHKPAPENYWSPPVQCCYEGPHGQCYMKC